MKKKEIKVLGNAEQLFPKLKAYSVDEILAAGGTTAFAEKLGKSWQNLMANLEKLPKMLFLLMKNLKRL
jgi:hypothetical protein